MEIVKRTAVITGGGQGIGKATAKRFLQDGLNVIIAELDDEAGKETEAEFKSLGNIAYINCNVGNELSVSDMVEKTIGLYGRIDILVNNAAISANKPITELTFEEWNNVLSVNLSGAFLCSKYCSPYLKLTKGSIINIASTRAFMSEPNTEAYSASKGGIFALTHALAASLGPDIRVNSISPGWIEVSDWKKGSKKQQPYHTTEDKLQHPCGRVGNPEDISSMIAFLTAPENSFITGANFTVDGGMTHKMIYV